MHRAEPAATDTVIAEVVAPVVKTFDELTPEELYGILQLRSRAFVVEQECVFLDADGVDTLPETLHIFYPRPAGQMADTHGAAFGRDLSPWAYARLLPAHVPDGPAARPGARSISRVATHPEARGQGWGRRLLAGIVDAWSDSPLTLNAQSHLEGLYGSFGFTPNGPRFLEDGLEHTPMERPAD
ncbi:GNAT family N-acetyltransferase [Brevibacterium spongiae]|uniref:GNAT family N-acetyltransferase n=1 Tax=Brevibacterium spongiae TaxID=2909672 RepID=A0ABY5SN40_9MICO|nr:GNAT family N-acetyltransferase [Brevibacterium spongiae]UVI34591.1 GNAT family N-acetyltransferase [Brevibacterium spongiae]